MKVKIIVVRHHTTVSTSLSAMGREGEQLSVPNFEKEEIRKKMSVWWDLKSSCHR